MFIDLKSVEVTTNYISTTLNILRATITNDDYNGVVNIYLFFIKIFECEFKFF